MMNPDTKAKTEALRTKKEEDNEKLRRLCDGTRTTQEIATRMGWKWERTRDRLGALGLKAARDTR